MKPYRIKHKATGLYYQPLVNGNNLSKTGKVYLTSRNCLNGDRFSYVIIELNPQGRVYKEYEHLFKKKLNHFSDITFEVSKTEFGKEEL